MEKWFVSAKKADFNKIALRYGISPVLARIIRNRDIVEDEDIRVFLEGTLADCHSPLLLRDMEKACGILWQKIREGKPIRVIGDYDVDGICSSYILTKGLSELGARVDTAIPHRIHDGYGLNEQLIEAAYQDGIDTIVTCDNGIAAGSQIQRANELLLTVIVTDHHEVPYEERDGVRHQLLPPAAAVVDPRQEGCSYPYKNICGAVVAWKLIQAMTALRGLKEQEKNQEALLLELASFAAIATVCDVMELKGENRIIVKEGLKLLGQTKNQGLLALMEVNGIAPDTLSAYHLGFVLGPCLNATGRLDTALRALELLKTSSRQEAMSAAAELKALNDSRKNLTREGVERACAQIEEQGMAQDKVLVVYLPDVHESLAGIIAGRIREKYHHPVFVLTDGEEGVKGSGRSIEAYHMYEHMTAVKEVFSKFGGHKLAAGLTLRHSHNSFHEDVEGFRRALNDSCELTEEDFIPHIHIDVPMPISYADEKLVRELSRLEPFGVGNPKPLFAQKALSFVRGYLMGAKGSCARYRVRTPEGTEAELVFFGDLERFHIFLDEKYGSGSAKRLYQTYCDYQVSVTYQAGINSYRGRESLQLVMQNYC